MSVRLPYLTARRLGATLAALGAFLAVSVGAGAPIGPVHVNLWAALTAPPDASPDHVILFRTRLPRILLSAIVGACLATAGAALQGLLCNPLACPHVLGISAGAAGPRA